CGQGMPSVLLLHAAPQSSSMFSSALKRFAARGLHAVAVDLPNCGESSRSSVELTIADVAEIVLQAIQGLRFTHTIDLIGHQTGATVALQIASDLPQVVRRVVLWGVPMLGFMERGDVLREEPPDYDGDLEGTVATFLEKRYPYPVPWQLKVEQVKGGARGGDVLREEPPDYDGDLEGTVATFFGEKDTLSPCPGSLRGACLLGHLGWCGAVGRGLPMLGFMERGGGDVLREEPPDYDGDLEGTVATFLEKRYPYPVPWQLKSAVECYWVLCSCVIPGGELELWLMGSATEGEVRTLMDILPIPPPTSVVSPLAHSSHGSSGPRRPPALAAHAPAAALPCLLLLCTLLGTLPCPCCCSAAAVSDPPLLLPPPPTSSAH
ncbi:unnamed protein product, partial [Closterium sp. NIES-54]